MLKWLNKQKNLNWHILFFETCFFNGWFVSVLGKKLILKILCLSFSLLHAKWRTSLKNDPSLHIFQGSQHLHSHALLPELWQIEPSYWFSFDSTSGDLLSLHCMNPVLQDLIRHIKCGFETVAVTSHQLSLVMAL